MAFSDDAPAQEPPRNGPSRTTPARTATPHARARAAAALALEIAVITAGYFALAKLGLMLASVNPSATPIWPPSGFALAMVLLRGYRIAPAIFVGAFLANAATAGSLETSAIIGVGNMLEAMIGARLIQRWAQRLDCFETPAGVACVLVHLLHPAHHRAPRWAWARWPLPALPIRTRFGSIWLTWWLGDVAGRC